MNLWAIFLTGLTTGGLSCLAVQGGLLAGIIANQKEDELDTSQEKREVLKEKKRQKYLDSLQRKNTLASSFDELDWLPVTLFLGAKLVSHTILGFFLGWLGSQLELT